jgi:acetyltransferase
MAHARPGTGTGPELRIRLLRRCDDRPIRELYDRLSPRSRYLRFFSTMPRLPEPLLNSLVCIDYRRRLALLAEVRTVDGHEVVALGNYGATDDRTVEVGLVVRDDWQQQGIGTALAMKLLEAAAARGFDRFVAGGLSVCVRLRGLFPLPLPQH